MEQAAVAVIFFICAFLSLFAGKKNGDELKAFLSEHVTRLILEEAFEVDEYMHKGSISENTIKSAELFEGWNTYTGNDYVRGKYKGHDIQFCDVHLENVSEDSEYGEQRSTIFRGPWIILEHVRDFPSPVRVRERSFLRRRWIFQKRNEIKTENAAFNKQFQILARDGHTAFLILTPHFMEFLISADEKAKGDTLICFDGSSICIAIHNDKDSFGASGKMLKDVAKIRESHKNDLKYLTDILDELMQNDYLFNQN